MGKAVPAPSRNFLPKGGGHSFKTVSRTQGAPVHRPIHDRQFASCTVLGNLDKLGGRWPSTGHQTAPLRLSNCSVERHDHRGGREGWPRRNDYLPITISLDQKPGADFMIATSRIQRRRQGIKPNLREASTPGEAWAKGDPFPPAGIISDLDQIGRVCGKVPLPLGSVLPSAGPGLALWSPIRLVRCIPRPECLQRYGTWAPGSLVPTVGAVFGLASDNCSFDRGYESRAAGTLHRGTAPGW